MMVLGRIKRLAGRGEVPALFAPVAQRPSALGAARPGGDVAATPVAAATGSRPTAVFRYAAAGVALCLVAVPMLVWTGILENSGSPAMWLLRTTCYLALIAVALMLSHAVPFGRRARGVGWALIASGAVIFETGILDMHFFGLIQVDHHNLIGDAVFHNVGPALALAGGAVLFYGAAGRTKISRRSSRSTVTSARPSSSAVTVSSTPPTTT